MIDEERMMMPLLELAAGYGKPIAFHIGADFYENTHPFRLGRIATRFPEITFMMVHMGGAGVPALDRAAVETATANPNIHLIGSGIPERAILRAIHVLGPDRVSFGSDMPFGLLYVQLAMYRAMLRDHDRVAHDKIMGCNLARILSA